MKLDFKYMEKALLDYNAKSELKQAAIIMVRNIFKEAETKQCDIPVVSSSAKPRKKTKKCDYCQKRKDKDNMYFLYKEGTKQYWICDDCNWEHDVV